MGATTFLFLVVHHFKIRVYYIITAFFFAAGVRRSFSFFIAR